MASINYYLKEKGKTTDTLIYLFVSYNSKRLKFSSGEKINPKYWNEENQRARKIKAFPYHAEFNTYLDNLAEKAKDIIRTYRNDKQRTPTTNELRGELKEYLGKTEQSAEKSPLGYFRKILDNRTASGSYSKSSIKTYKSVINHFDNYTKNHRLEFIDLDTAFFRRYRDYLLNRTFKVKRKEILVEENYSSNYIHKLISMTKTFCNQAYKDGLCKKLDFEIKNDLNISKESAQSIYLTLEELSHIFSLDLSENLKLDRVRDLFIIGAFTGLRFSDFTTIRPEHIINDGGTELISLITQKTGEQVEIPLHPYIKAILNKYGNVLPKAISNQKMNDYLKELGKVAELDDKILITKTKGGKKETKSFSKWELLSTHCARRSFATNAYKAGLPSISIMKITGHTSETVFLKYIKITKRENALLMAKSAFFNTSPLKIAN